MGYSNPDLDKLLNQARQELDLNKEVPIYQQIQQILVQDFPSTYAWYRPYIHVFKNKYAGYTVQNVLVEGVFNRFAELVRLVVGSDESDGRPIAVT